MRSVLTAMLFITPLFLFSQNVTTLTLQPGSEGIDANPRANNATDPYSDAPTLNIYTWTNSGVIGARRGYLNFDLSALPSNATIQNAWLSLYYNPDDNVESVDEHMGDNAWYIERVIENWEESTTNWNNLPNSTTVNQISIPAATSPTQDFTDIDVTTLVSDMMNDSAGVNGFVLKMQNEENPFRMLLLASSDHPNSCLRPKLEIDYTFENCTVQFSNSDIYIDNINKGIIMKSADGTCFRIRVNDDGSLYTLQIDCPTQ